MTRYHENLGYGPTRSACGASGLRHGVWPGCAISRGRARNRDTVRSCAGAFCGNWSCRRRVGRPAGSHPRRATHRSWPPRFWRGPVTSPLEPAPPDAVAMSDDLPPPNTQRWVVRRKAAVITAVRSGRITLEEALRGYDLTEEEYRSWEQAFDEHGLHGLRSTRLQQYRGPRPARRPRSRR
jgi:hypothetical protein